MAPPLLETTFVTSADNKCIVGIINGGHLNLQHVIVDGQGVGNDNYRLSGIGFRNSGGKIANCKIKEVRDTPLSGAQHGAILDALP